MINYQLPATKGTQAGKEFFTATIPFKFLVRMFKFDEESVPADLRAQRKLNEQRAQAIADYILSNQDSYVLPAITASCDRSMRLENLVPGHEVGLLSIPIDACLLINDGQHRRMGIALALREAPELAEHSISVTLYFDRGLRACQQMFADINSRATKPSGSLNALYDLRNPFARWVMDILGRRPAIRCRIDMENASPSKNSPHLWSLIAFHKFVGMLTGVSEKNIGRLPDLEAKTREVVEFLDALGVIPFWTPMLEGKIAAETMREQYIISHAVFLHALAVLGAHTADLRCLQGLAGIDPAKSSPLWQGRSVINGKMRKTSDGVNATAAVLMRFCAVSPPELIARLDALCSQHPQAA